ncbi:MAG: hypothetical protein QOH63_2233 [Acidobacteriota bacterium]|jgi:hypothetical protein|nr:hypothetical protein [Acidobacteriota bacterium]
MNNSKLIEADLSNNSSTNNSELRPVEGEDYYLENGFYVFKASFLRRRGYCLRDVPHSWHVCGAWMTRRAGFPTKLNVALRCPTWPPARFPLFSRKPFVLLRGSVEGGKEEFREFFNRCGRSASCATR